MLIIRNISKIYSLLGNNNALPALSDISFTANPGDIVGIIGKNGSGKSTLLKIISGIVSPTSGEVEFMGALSSLLEIGGGIHPDLSGKENYFLKGQMMGLTKKYLTENYASFIEFTEIDEFINEPVKHYSNGMYMRLAFGIGLMTQADIFLFDEVIAVGDAAFQIKCYNEIQRLAQTGAIIILVSHNLHELEKYCNRFLWIENGRIYKSSSSTEIIYDYLTSLYSEFFHSNNEPEIRTEEISIKNLNIFNEQNRGDKIYNLDTIGIELDMEFLKSPISVSLTLVIQDYQSTPIFSIPTFNDFDHQISQINKAHKLQTIIKEAFLNPGLYTVSVYLYIENELYRFKNINTFQVYPSKNDRDEKFFKGYVRNDFQWRVMP